MSKVLPHNEPSLSDNNEPNTVLKDTGIFDSNNEENSHLLNDERSSKFSSKKGGLLSFKAFVVCSIILLVVLSSVATYLSVFIGLYTSIDTMTSMVVANVMDKIELHLNIVLGRMSTMSRIAAEHYSYGLVTLPYYREYFFTAYKLYGIFLGYGFPYPSERYNYIWIGKDFMYTAQAPGALTTRDLVNSTTGQVIKYNVSTETSPFSVLKKTDYFTYYVEETAKIPGNPEGVFGQLYYPVNGSLSFQYGSKLYDPVQFKLGKKVIKGACRCSIPLFLLTDFLEPLKVFERGYVLLTEEGSTMAVAGSINTTTADLKSTLSIFNITDRNAGQLMKDIQNVYGFDKMPPKLKITSLGVNYIVTSKLYTMENVKWRIFVVVYEDDVSLTTNISIGVSISAVVIIVALSILYSIGLSHIVTGPISHLKQQFQFIKVFDLDQVCFKNSLFKEMNEIYCSLFHTTQWLKEIKSFVPENVFLQLQSDQNENNSHKQETTVNEPKNKKGTTAQQHVTASSSHDDGMSNNELSSHQSSSRHHQSMGSRRSLETGSGLSDAMNLFKMGLTSKQCTVVYILLPEYFLMNSQSEITHSFPRILSYIGTISKLVKGDLQIIANDEFRIVIEHKNQGKSSATLAQECALKIKTALDTLENMIKKKTQLFSIGISSDSKAYIGNLGTKNQRYYSIVSNASFAAKNLALMAHKENIKILIDEETQSQTSQQFVTRPISRILNEQYVQSCSPKIFTAYYLIRDSVIENDEWLYELEKANENKSIQGMHEHFNALFQNNHGENLSQEQFVEHVSRGVGDLKKYVASHENDELSMNILELFEHLQKEIDYKKDITALINKVKEYHVKVQRSLIYSSSGLIQ
ncbi:hypothetical protein C9374_014379 [Naegleria lovaniensis]|uniref:Guanylate cyclase domain-containing protein n=1 Tax=Naegleria lovaniensis TaxID=51637 RepID=A0AA88GZT9_NAELO|nr:uncharacterized protein C9374_014379 [Naegleria lovaniensis]KAG2388979.1 hypothetical protein C9374_014379 [Naegleria lovaniensis]